ncbi:SprT family protein [Oceanobacillus locisalsi]|uniref:Protein SprT-like n=1 Tax=Oceanobacillus locisalsi TaxID=546107 RepID=A0ABW3NKS4_9BACI
MNQLSDEELYQLVNRLSETFFHKSFHDKAHFNSRLRTTGGRYIPSKRLIEINPKYVLEFEEEELHGIIKHELCHYHLHIEGKGYQHRDREFRELLAKTGSPRHCKQLPSQQNRYRYTYECEKCKMTYKRIRKVDVSRFRCGKCKGKLIRI